MPPVQPPGRRSLGRRATAVALAGLLAVGTVPALALSGAGLAPAATADAGTPIAASNIKPEVAVDANGTTLGAIASFSQADNVVTLAPAKGSIRVTFLDDGNFRLEATPTGTFTDPANTPETPADPTRTADIVVGAGEFNKSAVTVTDAGGVITMATATLKLEADKATGAFTLKRADGSVV